MDNLGDWLYIILLVIAGVSGLFSSARKKKQPVEAPSQPEEDVFREEENQEPKSFWELLESMQKEQTRVQQPKPKQQPPMPQVKQQTKKISPHTSLKQTGIPEDEAFRIPSESFQDTEELKKAIIYSEILNRKY